MFYYVAKSKLDRKVLIEYERWIRSKERDSNIFHLREFLIEECSIRASAFQVFEAGTSNVRKVHLLNHIKTLIHQML